MYEKNIDNYVYSVIREEVAKPKKALSTHNFGQFLVWAPEITQPNPEIVKKFCCSIVKCQWQPTKWMNSLFFKRFKGRSRPSVVDDDAAMRLFRLSISFSYNLEYYTQLLKTQELNLTLFSVRALREGYDWCLLVDPRLYIQGLTAVNSHVLNTLCILHGSAKVVGSFKLH